MVQGVKCFPFFQETVSLLMCPGLFNVSFNVELPVRPASAPADPYETPTGPGVHTHHQPLSPLC